MTQAVPSTQADLHAAPTPGREPILRVTGLRFDVGGERILDAVEFDVRSGQFVCVLGPSGCGKTTLLRLIGGLLSPTDGEIWVGGRRAAVHRHQAAFVFQNARLCGWRTAAQNVMLGLELRAPGLAGEERRRRVDRYLKLVRLDDRRDRFPATLSGGEAQRVALARALAVESPILLMDEPFANLDVRTRDQMRQALLDVWQVTGRTVVFVTHDIDEALLLADHIVVLSDRPTRVVQQMAVDLKRPREPEDPAFEERRREIRSAFAVGNPAGRSDGRPHA